MNIGILTVRDRAYHPNRRLLETAEGKGHRAFLIHPYRLWPVIAKQVLGVTRKASFTPPDVVLPRQGAEIGVSSRVLINQLDLMGIPLVNNPAAIRLTSNQFLTLQALAAAGVPVPDTLFINAGECLDLDANSPIDYPVVVKQINGRQGSGVALAHSRTELERLVAAQLDRTRGLLLQRFIAPDGRQDIRALVIGGRVTAAMRLIPSPGEFRANFHLGARSRMHNLTDATARVAAAAAAATGLDIAGVDLIIEADGRIQVIEVNYAPGFRGLEAATGLDIASAIIDHAVAVIRRTSTGTQREFAE